MEETNRSMLKAYSITFIIIIVMGVLLFLPAGSFRFWQAWIFWLGSSVLMIFIAVYSYRKSPELLQRRLQFKEKKTTAKPPAFTYLSYLGYIIPGLDFRFQWSAVPVGIVIASNVMVFLGYILMIIVFNENRYASTIIQVEEKQQVISTGLYSIVRHPMYLGMLLIYLFAPLALGSYWAIMFFLLNIPYLVLRIKSEEKMLLQDLPGYREYCQKTRYRLLPSIW